MTDPLTPIRKLCTIPHELPSLDDEVKQLADHALANDCIAGPIYQSINKRLASIYFKEQQDQLAIYHLTESHGCSLRHHALYRYGRMIEKGTPEQKELGTKLFEIVSIDGQHTLDKSQGLLSRLAELPSDWTIVQLTVQYDPLLRVTQQPTRKHNPIHLTRMSCGSLVKKMSTDKQGGLPLSLLLSPYSNSSDVLDIVTTLNEALESHRLLRKTEEPNRNQKRTLQFSSTLQSLIKDFEKLLGDTSCVFLGNLMDTKLHKTICTKVDKIVKDLAGSTEISQTQLQVLYLLATSSLRLKSMESEVLNIVINDSCLAAKLYKAIKDLHDEYEIRLYSSVRHPVIFILDELLDLFPIEMINVLKDHPVSRISSIHFAHALYQEHSLTVFRSGANGENGYYIINPSGDLKDCEQKFRNFLPSIAPTWEGIFGEPPTESQFLDALAKKSIFLYCGHGGGNQYAETTDIERNRTQAVSFVIGCSSMKLIPMGGRVDGFSIFNSYTIGGCPCAVGMLWDVTDVDANRMTEFLLKHWLKQSASESMEEFCTLVKNLNIQGKEAEDRDLLRLLPAARARCDHLRNAAALVVRGLPVKIKRSS